MAQSPPAVTYPSPDEWPQTIVSISGISRDSQAKITADNHGFTTEDVGITFVDFTQIEGMIQMNGQTGLIQSVIDTNNFTVNINTSQFYAYTAGGWVNNMTGSPPLAPTETIGFQTFNTPFKNTFTTN